MRTDKLDLEVLNLKARKSVKFNSRELKIHDELLQIEREAYEMIEKCKQGKSDYQTIFIIIQDKV